MAVSRKTQVIGTVVLIVGLAGCEVTLSVFLQKDWNTNPDIFKANDMVSKAELKVTRKFGKDALKEIKK